MLKRKPRVLQPVTDAFADLINRNVISDVMAWDGKTFRIVLLDPPLAEAYLKYNTANRHDIPGIISKYSKDQAESRWLFTGDPLQFCVHPSGEAEFVNGQHRCKAVIKSGVAIEVMVITGLVPEAKSVLDLAKSRTVADLCALNDIKYGRECSAIARTLWAMKARRYAALTSAISNTISFGLILKHPLMVQSISDIGAAPQLRPSTMAAVHYCAKHLLKKPAEADAFITVFRTGEASYKGDPAFAWFLSQINAFKNKTHPLKRPDVLRAYIYAWNAFVANQSISPKDFAIPSDDVVMTGLESAML